MRTLVFLFGALAGCTQIAAQELPPPLPPSYHPNPGPFVVLFDKNGSIPENQRPILASAIESWRGNGRGAFLLCFHHAENNKNSISSSDKQARLKTVANSLKELGAKSTLYGSEEGCRASKVHRSDWGNRVQIRGILTPFVDKSD